MEITLIHLLVSVIPIATFVLGLLVWVFKLGKKVSDIEAVADDVSDLKDFAYNRLRDDTHAIRTDLSRHLGEADARDVSLKERVDSIEGRINRKWNGVSKHE